jgi:hypothetical protein
MSEGPARLDMKTHWPAIRGVCWVMLLGCLTGGAAGHEDARWDYRFGQAGLGEGGARACVWFRGELYVGGNFLTAGHWLAHGVARWDGTNWWPVGEGLSTTNLVRPSVRALAVYRDQLYAGGGFSRSGPRPLPGLARWDGTRWVAVPGVVHAYVTSLQVREDGLWACGNLQFEGDTNWYGVARWDGQHWDGFGSKIAAGDFVSMVVVWRGELFVSGVFNAIGGQPISYLARWDGSGWKPWSVVTNRTFWAMAADNDHLYVSGDFKGIGGVAATNLARWDGVQWEPVGGDFDQPPEALVSGPGGLLALGRFQRIGSVVVDGIARWDGTNWWPLGLGIWSRAEGPSAACISDDHRLFVVGYFYKVHGQRAGHVAEWTGTQWAPLLVRRTLGLTDGYLQILCLTARDGALYAGGVYSDPEAGSGRAVWRLESNGWSRLPGDFRNDPGQGAGTVSQLMLYEDELVVGGAFTYVGDVAGSNLARWTGSGWAAFGGGTDGAVRAMVSDGTNLFVGGEFTTAGGVAAAGVARWDGTRWHPLGSGVVGAVNALAWSDGILFAGGTFTNAGGLAVNRVAAWRAGRWEPLGDGVDGGSRPSVEAIAVDGTNVYVGGRFTRAGGVTVNNLARWDGREWHPVGEPPEDGVLARATAVHVLVVRDGMLYAGGSFTNAGGKSLSGLARFDGVQWTTLGSGLHGVGTTAPIVRALVWEGDALWVGGLFIGAGTRAAASVARWVDRPQIRLALPMRLESDKARLRIWGVEGLRFGVEASSDLVNWAEVAQGEGDSDEWEGVVPAASPARFYRAVLRP